MGDGAVIPVNEQGVIVLFAQQAEKAGFEIVEIHAEFPDSVARKNGVEYRIEFEYQSSNFRAHKHDVRKCDIIVCWERDSKSVLPILALSEHGWETTEIVMPSDSDRDIEYWRQRALSAEQSLKLAVKPVQSSEPERRFSSKSEFLEFMQNGNSDRPANASDLEHRFNIPGSTSRVWMSEWRSLGAAAEN